MLTWPHGTPKPRLELQGSDGYLKKQWRLIAKGELGYIPAKHIVSALPEEGGHPAGSHGGQQTHPGYGGFTDHGGRAGDALEGHREGPGPHPMGNGRMSAGEIDAPATLGLEDGHHHGGETP